MNSDPEEDPPVGELPEDIGEGASDGDFRVEAWLAGLTLEPHEAGAGGAPEGAGVGLVISLPIPRL